MTFEGGSVLDFAAIVIAAALSLVGVLYARRIDNAVNHKGRDEPTLKEKVDYLVGRQVEFDTHGWDKLPPRYGTAEGLTKSLDQLHNDLGGLHAGQEQIGDRISSFESTESQKMEQLAAKVRRMFDDRKDQQ